MPLDFLQIGERAAKKASGEDAAGIEVFPDFAVGRTTDLMIQGGSFKAVWDSEKNLWSTDEYEVYRMVDEALWAYRNQRAEETGRPVRVLLMKDFSSGGLTSFRRYLKNMPDFYAELDENLVFANSEVTKGDYATKRLPYSLEEGSTDAWEEMLSTLYAPVEREKIEWIIGAIVSGDSKHIQKMGAFYGAPGTGKSTIIGFMHKELFDGYTSTFEAKALTSGNSAFATEAFKNNPLVAIEHDSDLSQIKDYTKLNSLASHEMMQINEKFKPSYEMVVNAFLVVGTNTPIRITDAKAGILRRLIDIHPTGKTLSARKYQTLMAQMKFEVGAIAHYCLQIYQSRGKNYYDGYKPVAMMLQTDVFYNYVEYYYDTFSRQDGITLDQAYTMYKEFANDTGVEYKKPRHIFREELRNYFEYFEERTVIDGQRVRSWYSGFKIDKFKSETHVEEEVLPLVLDESSSIFDELMMEMDAQYSKADGTPQTFWDQVETKLSDLDTSKEHYVRVPEHHIVIDFDLVDETGNKSLEKNLEAASTWPATYSELSKSGAGLHLHYNYVGDVHELKRIYADNIEIKVFSGKTSLRRKLSLCNNVPVATMNGGLPLREKKVYNGTQIKTEAGLRDLIGRHMRKEIMHSTKPSIDMISKILDENYERGLAYDLSDLKGRMIAFANGSTNQAQGALMVALKMKYKSEGSEVLEQEDEFIPDDQRLAFFDVEVYKNLFVICWKYQGSDTMVHMINPKPHEVEQLLRLKLVGFNNRRYDNHILYGAKMGYNNEALYKLSKRIIDNEPGGTFGAAYNASWVDIYDFAMTKMGLKKWETELGINHVEMDLDWDQPAPPELWDKIVAYCDNDVMATEAVFEHLSGDYTARLILAELSGLSVNSTTQQHTAQIVFEGDRMPQNEHIYTELGEDKLDGNGDVIEPALFPGYKFFRGKSTYRDEEVNEGGYVYAEPGIYDNVALLDVASMHPTSIIALNLFGDKYTKNFKDILDARIAIKRGKFDDARNMLGGRLRPYLKETKDAKNLSNALKVGINIVYGLTAAKFPNAFKDPRNKDNIVAKRGALFMVDLKHAVQEQGFVVAHIKTDSIKIPNATPEIIQFVMEFGARYGYEFEHEATYQKLALITKADYVAKEDGHWTATGATLQQPYVFKKLFSDEEIEFEDLCLTKQVQNTVMYLDFTEGYANEAGIEKALHFVGKVGVFVPIKEGRGGGLLVREKGDKFDAVTGTKGFRFQEAHVIKELGKEEDIDLGYFDELVDEAKDKISKFGDFEMFIS